jgi:hypothetical protein
VVNDQVYHGWVNTSRDRQVPQNRSLIQGTRVSIKDKPVAAIRLLNPLFDQPVHQIVRDEPSRPHAALDVAAD